MAFKALGGCVKDDLNTVEEAQGSLKEEKGGIHQDGCSWWVRQTQKPPPNDSRNQEIQTGQSQLSLL